MNSTQPWDVRHIYTTADPRYNRTSHQYLDKMKRMLQDRKDEGRIRAWEDCGVGAGTDIVPALRKSKPGELVIIDLHGSKYEAWLGVTPEDGVRLHDALPVKSWDASVIFLTGCWGSTDQFGEALNEFLAHQTTVISHSTESEWLDHTPIDLISTVLEHAPGADASGAYVAVDVYLRSHWGVYSRG